VSVADAIIQLVSVADFVVLEAWLALSVVLRSRRRCSLADDPLFFLVRAAPVKARDHNPDL
jgi:hypothetical protein